MYGYGWCDNSDEHKKEGRDDYNRHGRYGYDREKYDDHWDDCNRAYRDGFNEARDEDDRRQERYEQEQREERRQQQQARERREAEGLEWAMLEESYYNQQIDPLYDQQVQNHIERNDKREPETDDLPF